MLPNVPLDARLFLFLSRCCPTEETSADLSQEG